MFARKMWNFFTNTLQSKLHKLNKSKAIKKPQKRRLTQKNQKKTLCFPNFSIQSKRKNQKYRFKPTRKLQKHKKPSPVYIDQLFLHSTSLPARMEVQTLQTVAVAQPVRAIKKTVSLPAQMEVQAAMPVHAMKMKGIDSEEPKEECSTSRKEMQLNSDAMQSTEGPDDMWESLGLASPLTHRINERAEEFIARFREEMHNEETYYRR